MNIARIERSSGKVVNVEVATPEWLASNGDDPEYLFVEVPEGDPLPLRMYWDAVTGFSQPPLTPPSEESIAWAAQNGDTSWVDEVAKRAG